MRPHEKSNHPLTHTAEAAAAMAALALAALAFTVALAAQTTAARLLQQRDALPSLPLAARRSLTSGLRRSPCRRLRGGRRSVAGAL